MWFLFGLIMIRVFLNTFGRNYHNSHGDLEKYQFCQHPVSDAEISASMGKHGFSNDLTGYSTIDLTFGSSKIRLR